MTAGVAKGRSVLCAGAAVLGAAVAGFLASVALAGPPPGGTAPATYDGPVVATSSGNVRRAPTRLSVKLYGDAGTTRMYCKVPGPTIDGNRRWYWLRRPGRDGWVAARYVENVRAVPPSCRP